MSQRKKLKVIAAKERKVDKAPITPARAEALAKLCPDLESRPQRWRYEQSDIAPRERIVECFRSFLLRLLEQGLARKTLRRIHNHLTS